MRRSVGGRLVGSLKMRPVGYMSRPVGLAEDALGHLQVGCAGGVGIEVLQIVVRAHQPIGGLVPHWDAPPPHGELGVAVKQLPPCVVPAASRAGDSGRSATNKLHGQGPTIRPPPCCPEAPCYQRHVFAAAAARLARLQDQQRRQPSPGCAVVMTGGRLTGRCSAQTKGRLCACCHARAHWTATPRLLGCAAAPPPWRPAASATGRTTRCGCTRAPC